MTHRTQKYQAVTAKRSQLTQINTREKARLSFYLRNLLCLIWYKRCIIGSGYRKHRQVWLYTKRVPSRISAGILQLTVSFREITRAFAGDKLYNVPTAWADNAGVDKAGRSSKGTEGQRLTEMGRAHEHLYWFMIKCQRTVTYGHCPLSLSKSGQAREPPGWPQKQEKISRTKI